MAGSYRMSLSMPRALSPIRVAKEHVFHLPSLVSPFIPKGFLSGEDEEKRMLRILDSYSTATRNAFVYLISQHYPRSINDNKRKPFIRKYCRLIHEISNIFSTFFSFTSPLVTPSHFHFQG